ncbi:hypothetical protein CEN41_19820 [Fischerella thermalis CCMEE 5330]|uniref:Uncharacterized protein n=1 Tax=Fischerella thermalis CCMEE 5330 TaxID=2019670 RepID=A0A2N6M0G0_9CYAN|nr:hypothetical protein CEN41_19820 [Fischerella thermalis CCMEE 5330]
MIRGLHRIIDPLIRDDRKRVIKRQNPVVTLIKKVYSTGVKLTTEAMAEVEKQILRLPHLKKWFVEIFAKPGSS